MEYITFDEENQKVIQESLSAIIAKSDLKNSFNIYILTSLLASQFTFQESKSADAETGLADELDAPETKSEWGRNARMNSNNLAG